MTAYRDAIDRRRFMQLCAGSMAYAAVGCGRDPHRARAEQFTITVLPSSRAEWAFGPFGWTSQFLVFLPLVTRNAKGELEGRLAESWEHSPDYCDWTIHLRKDVRWQDGVSVTAHDIKFTLDLLSNPEVLEIPPDAVSTKVLDNYTYTLKYHKPAGGSPLDDRTVYYPKHLLEKLDPKNCYDWDFWTHPVGDGPYRFVRYVAKTMIELEANPDYYRGKPRIQRVVLKYGAAELLTELLSGNVDVIHTNRMDLLKLEGDPRFQAFDYMTGSVVAVVWNQRHPLFRDPRVRRALTLAINRRELHQVLNLPENTPVFDVLFTPEQFWRGALPAPLPYDPEQAKRLLEEAGWRDGDANGVRKREEDV